MLRTTIPLRNAGILFAQALLELILCQLIWENGVCGTKTVRATGYGQMIDTE